MSQKIVSLLAKLPPLRRISFYLWMFGGAMLLGSLIITPMFVVSAVRADEVARSGVTIVGEVIAHKTQVQKRQTRHFATVKYEVARKTYRATIEGVGAVEERLPIGTKLSLRYHPKYPDHSILAIQDASTDSGPPWIVILLMWLTPVCLFLFAWILGRVARKYQIPADSDFETTPYVHTSIGIG